MTEHPQHPQQPQGATAPPDHITPITPAPTAEPVQPVEPIEPTTPAHTATPPDRDIFGREPVRTADWSHRRGEPRGLALAWAVFLLLGSAMALRGAATSGIVSVEAYRVQAARFMVVTAVAAGILWPMFRLSQESPRRPLRALLVDIFVLVVPLQVVVWPQAILAGWSLARCAAVAGLLTAWIIAAGSIVAAGLFAGRKLWRAAAMLLILIAALTAPSVAAVQNAATPTPTYSSLDTPPAFWVWLSPIGSIYEVTRDRTWAGGREVALRPGVRGAVWVSLISGLAAWAGILALRVAHRPNDA